MKSLRAVWWIPLLTSLLVGFALFVALPSTAYLANDETNAILFIAAAGAIFPWIIARIHSLPRLRLVSASYVIALSAWLSLKTAPTLALLAPWIIAEVLMVAVAASLMLRKLLLIEKNGGSFHDPRAF